MGEPIKQDFRAAEERRKRLLLALGVLLFIMFAMVQGLSIAKGRPFDFTFLGFFGVTIGCLWWVHMRAREQLRQQSLTEWQMSDQGLEWIDPTAGCGVFLWSEIVAMDQIDERLQLRCQKTEAETNRQLEFSLFIGKERGAELKTRWETQRMKRSG